MSYVQALNLGNPAKPMEVDEDPAKPKGKGGGKGKGNGKGKGAPGHPPKLKKSIAKENAPRKKKAAARPAEDAESKDFLRELAERAPELAAQIAKGMSDEFKLIRSGSRVRWWRHRACPGKWE